MAHLVFYFVVTASRDLRRVTGQVAPAGKWQIGKCALMKRRDASGFTARSLPPSLAGKEKNLSLLYNFINEIISTSPTCFI